MRLVPMTLSALLVLTLPVSAVLGAAARPATPAAPRPAAASKSASAEATPSTSAEEDALERALEQRWRKTRAVRVIAERRYPKARRFELGLFVGSLPNDPFLVYLAAGGRLAWHFSEWLALELSGAYTHGFDTGLRKSLEEQDALATAQIRDRVLGRLDLALLWSPVYGKLAWTAERIGHFDLYFLLCASGLWAEAHEALDLQGGPWGGAGLGVGFRFFLSRLISLRVEFRQRVEIREGVGDASVRVSYPSELSLGVSFLLGGSRRRP